jgi:hypothetical protein
VSVYIVTATTPTGTVREQFRSERARDRGVERIRAAHPSARFAFTAELDRLAVAEDLATERNERDETGRTVTPVTPLVVVEHEDGRTYFRVHIDDGPAYPPTFGWLAADPSMPILEDDGFIDIPE